jgi:hypothetical protein
VTDRAPTNATEVFERIGSLEKHTFSLESRLGAVERNQEVHGHKLDEVLALVSRHRSFDLSVAIDVAYKAAVLFGLITAGIIYLAGNLNAGTGAVQDWRLSDLEQRIERYRTTTTVLEKGNPPQ